MKELIRAALGERTNRLLLIDISPSTLQNLLQRRETTFAAVTSARTRALRKIRDHLGNDGKYSVLRAELDQLPFDAPRFDIIIIDADEHRWDSPIEMLRSLRTLVRPGGAVMVVNRLREGPIGNVTSVVCRVLCHRHQALPRASDLTKWMLLAGLRKVRQANVPKALVPTVVTWAEVRLRPWEEVVGGEELVGDVNASQP